MLLYHTYYLVYIGCCTSKLHPADLSWNRQFKSVFAEMYYTKGDSRKPPPKKLYLKWIKEAWGTVTLAVHDKEIIQTMCDF